jgi:hypothetical protein
MNKRNPPGQIEDTTLSVEARVVAATWWGPMALTALSFKRPWIITVPMRRALDELTEKGSPSSS